MSDMSKYQACRDVETRGDLSTFNGRPSTTFGVQRQAHAQETASAAMKLPGHATVIREPSDSHLATPPIPSAPGSPVASMQGSPLPSHSGTAGGACPDRRQPDEDSIEPTSSADGQLALPTTAQPTDASLE